jgi:hypothetical protein
MKHSIHISSLSLILVLLGSSALMAQDTRVSIVWKIAPSCGATFPTAALHQELEDQLRAASIGVSRANSAGLVTAIDCQPTSTSMVPVQQCLSLSQAVSEPTAANGLHLATTWRNCRAYTCSKQTCGQLAHNAQRALVDQFIPAFRALSTKTEARVQSPVPQHQDVVAASVAYVAAPEPVLNPVVVFYMVYILACVSVLLLWQWRQFRTMS